MSCSAEPDPEQLLQLARIGDGQALGRLLEVYRNYLTLLAELQIDRRIQGKVDASDLVQETFLHAHRGFGKFQGTTEAELIEWLRRILASRLTDVLRHFWGTQRCDLRLERQLDQELDRSSQIAQALVLPESSPSQKAARREQAVVVADALRQLPADYRKTIVLHHFEQLSFLDVAHHMGRSIHLCRGSDAGQRAEDWVSQSHRLAGLCRG